MSLNLLAGVLAGAILSGTSLLYATLGEVIVERSGIVNLGLEGVLLVGASVAFAVASASGSALVGVLAAALAGGMMNLLFGYVVIRRRGNQLASGMALMFLGMGVSALVGRPYVGGIITGLRSVRVPLGGFAAVPVDLLVLLAVPVAFLVWLLLFRTSWGLGVRAAGEDPAVAFAAGRDPALLRFQALFAGGLLGGVGGAHLSLALTLTWSEGMTAGRGFIAIALVIFSKWHPLRAVVGALVFGGAEALQLQLQARGVGVSPFLMDMVPYLLTLLVLLLWAGTRRLAAPAALGRPYAGTE
jgi:general nucleoside transport system permease protein